MRVRVGLILLTSLTLTACSPVPVASLAQTTTRPNGSFVGFDRNDYPGDERLAELHKHFAFVGYWLNSPPGEMQNSWLAKRKQIRDAGFGFLILANGKLDAEIKKSKLTPTMLGREDAAQAIAAAQREGFPKHSLIFLDQEEGGRLLPEQADYFFGWTETVAKSDFKAGAYLSGQAAPDGKGPDGRPVTITTAQDVRGQVASRHLHPFVLWVQQDGCPPAPGCTLQPPPINESGTPDAPVWQYAQSPRRPELTRSCAKTYASDGSCFAGVSSDLMLDLDVSDSPDPSHGR